MYWNLAEIADKLSVILKFLRVYLNALFHKDIIWNMEYDKTASRIFNGRKIQKRTGKAILSTQGMLAALVLILLTGAAMAGLFSVEKLSKAALASKLETVLNTNVEALRIWIEDEKKFVKTWAENREVREAILKLVKPQNTSQEEVTHSSSPEFLERLRKILGPVCKIKNYFLR